MCREDPIEELYRSPNCYKNHMMSSKLSDNKEDLITECPNCIQEQCKRSPLINCPSRIISTQDASTVHSSQQNIAVIRTGDLLLHQNSKLLRIKRLFLTKNKNKNILNKKQK